MPTQPAPERVPKQATGQGTEKVPGWEMTQSRSSFPPRWRPQPRAQEREKRLRLAMARERGWVNRWWLVPGLDWLLKNS